MGLDADQLEALAQADAEEDAQRKEQDMEKKPKRPVEIEPYCEVEDL
jgi:hypothetical protein